MYFLLTNPSLSNIISGVSALMANQAELSTPEKKELEFKAIIEEQEKRLNNLQSTAFSLANYYFVFQGVILTIVCNGSEALKPSNRWFFLTLSILAALLNLVALIKIVIKYNKTKAEQENMEYQRDELIGRVSPTTRTIPDKQQHEQFRDILQERRGNLYLGLCIFFFLGFSAVVLVGCWKFLGNQNEVCKLPSDDKCIRLCNNAKCITICSEY